MAKRFALNVLVGLVSIGGLFAQGPKEFSGTSEEFQAQFGLQSGTIELPGGIATIRLPGKLRFIGKEGSRRLLTEGWGVPEAMSRRRCGCVVKDAPAAGRVAQ
jgi:hypothetical protein